MIDPKDQTLDPKDKTDDELVQLARTNDMGPISVEMTRRMKASTTRLTWAIIYLTAVLVVLTSVLVVFAIATWRPAGGG